MSNRSLQNRIAALERRTEALEERDDESFHWNTTNVSNICVATFACFLIVGCTVCFVAYKWPHNPTPTPVPDKTEPVVPPDNITPEPTPDPEPEPEKTFRDKIAEIASPLTTEIRDRWAWCYLDAVENYSTDLKLRENVRENSNKALTETQHKEAEPVNEKIKTAVEEEVKVRPIKDVYADVGEALKVNGWTYELPKTTPNQTGSIQTAPKATRYRLVPRLNICPTGNCPL